MWTYKTTLIGVGVRMRERSRERERERETKGDGEREGLSSEIIDTSLYTYSVVLISVQVVLSSPFSTPQLSSPFS